eukprot:110977_1
MDAEIIAASNYSIDFFQILYYDNYPTERETNSIYLNEGLKTFINSSESWRMKFFIEWCNTYPKFAVHNMTEWEYIIQNDWMPAFKHPSHLKIDNKLIFKVHNAQQLLQNCNGSNVCVEIYLNYLRNTVKNATNNDMLIGGGIVPSQPIRNKTVYGYNYDWIGSYMGVPSNSKYPPYETYPWEIMSNWTIEQRQIHRNDVIQYMPYLPVGWNPEPWNESRPFFDFPTNNEWISDLTTIKIDLNNNNNFRIADQKLFNIYAWNEFG